MVKDYAATADSVVTGANQLGQAMPDAMAAFGALGKAAYGDGALSPQTKELISLAISVAKSVLDHTVERPDMPEACVPHVADGPPSATRRAGSNG